MAVSSEQVNIFSTGKKWTLTDSAGTYNKDASRLKGYLEIDGKERLQKTSD
jgi:hypothetical protein